MWLRPNDKIGLTVWERRLGQLGGDEEVARYGQQPCTSSPQSEGLSNNDVTVSGSQEALRRPDGPKER